MAATALVFLALLRSTKFDDPLVSIATKYSVRVEVVDHSSTIQGAGYKIEIDTPSPEDLARYAKLFASEWNRYPTDVIKKARVTKIVIGSNIRLSGQARAAVPAFDLNAMYYDTTLGKYRPDYQRSVIHHEFFHMIDQREGLLYHDNDWAALNPTDFHYGNGGAQMRKPGVGNLTDKVPGFITLYSQSAVEEDKAEIFAHSLVDTSFVEARAKADPVVASKITLLKMRLKGWAASLDDAFWSTKAK